MDVLFGLIVLALEYGAVSRGIKPRSPVASLPAAYLAFVAWVGWLDWLLGVQ